MEAKIKLVVRTLPADHLFQPNVKILKAYSSPELTWLNTSQAHHKSNTDDAEQPYLQERDMINWLTHTQDADQPGWPSPQYQHVIKSSFSLSTTLRCVPGTG
ncbi:hypothetical protein AAHC03_0981 [Spirometra sp. Aus1]